MFLTIPPELEAATLCASGNCDISRRAACTVIAPHSPDPWFQAAIDNDAKHALRRPETQHEHQMFDAWVSTFQQLLEEANPNALLTGEPT